MFRAVFRMRKILLEVYFYNFSNVYVIGFILSIIAPKTQSDFTLDICDNEIFIMPGDLFHGLLFNGKGMPFVFCDIKVRTSFLYYQHPPSPSPKKISQGPTRSV